MHDNNFNKTFFFSGRSLCIQNTSDKIIAQERRENKTNMDPQSKRADDSLPDEKLKKAGLGQPQKIRNTLERWLLKPSKSPNAPEKCPNQKDVGVTDDFGFQSSSASSLDCKNAAKSSDSDMDEETQPLTPQDWAASCPMSPTSMDSTGSGCTQTGPRDEKELEEDEKELEEEPTGACATSFEGSAKKRIKITDFFSRTLSQSLPVKRGRPDTSSDGDRDKKVTPAEVRWLGTPISELKRMPRCGGTLPPLKDDPHQHTVMIRVCGLIP